MFRKHPSRATAQLQRGRRAVSRGIRKGWNSERARSGSPGCCAGVWSLLQPPAKDSGGTGKLQPAHKKVCASQPVMDYYF